MSPQAIAYSILSHRLILILLGVAFPYLLFLFLGNSLIDWLRNKRWKKDASQDETWAVREDTPDTHIAKKGTPSMGGIGIVSFATITYLALSGGVNPGGAFGVSKAVLSYPLLGMLLFHAFLGFADDWSKASGRGGLRARTKLFFQIVLAAFFAFYSLYLAIARDFVLSPTLPDVIPLWVIGGIIMFAVIATSNAANLTDGIDGLAAGIGLQAFLVLALFGWTQQGNVPGMLLCACMAGACAGFLLYNRYPAKVFMGDTGSLAIGALLGCAAIQCGGLFLLPFIGFMYFVEMLSVIAQVAYFKYTKRKSGEGKRLFRRAPLHHHFELGGWSEWRVVGTFWLVNLGTSLLGLALWQMGILPRWP